MYQTMFFHMNNLAGLLMKFRIECLESHTFSCFFFTDGCSFDDLRVGDEVEFMTGVNQKTKKESAIYVKKLR